MEESMKKVLLISLIAMMLIGMLMTACKPKVDANAADTTITEAPAVVDTTVVADTTVAAPAAAPAAAPKTK